MEKKFKLLYCVGFRPGVCGGYKWATMIPVRTSPFQAPSLQVGAFLGTSIRTPGLWGLGMEGQWQISPLGTRHLWMTLSEGCIRDPT